MKPEHPWFLKTSANFKPGCVALFGLPFLVGGLFCLWSMTLYPALEWWQARSWVEADAVIEKAWLKVTRGSEHDSYEVAVDFRYRYRGMAHAGSRHSFVSSSTNIGATGMTQTVERLKPGQKVSCWVNPDDPHQAVIDRSLPEQTLMGLFFSTPFLVMGVAGVGSLALPFLRQWFATRRRTQLTALVAAGWLPDWVLRPFGDDGDAHANDVALAIAADERLPLAVGVTFLNLFWNGIVAVFVYAEVAGLLEGDGGDGLLALFLIPFIVIGAGMIWMMVKLWRQTFLPGWVAALNPSPDLDGGDATFCWAWMDSRQRARPPQAAVRIVAQASVWDAESNSPTRTIGRKRRPSISDPDATHKTQLELAAVTIDLTETSGQGLKVHLPSAREAAKLLRNAHWGAWWQLEVTHADGTLEMPDLTKAVKLEA